ncbi:Bet v1-like protein [Rhodotorula sp. JG-1b]|nr:Bet v1-like protein [Rhodotorula sp. JG-1b]
MAVTIQEPALPAVPDYPVASPWTDRIDHTRQEFLDELATQDGWIDLGEKHGVRLSKKYRDNDTNPVPIVRGETVVEGVEPYAFLAGVVQPPGMRKLWDPRTEAGMMIKRFSRQEVLFYAVTKGKRFIASPRDLAGIQKDYVEPDGSCMIVQTSVDDADLPEQAHMKRATLSLSGWNFKPEGPNTRITYIFQIALNGSIPNAVVALATTETPLCTGRARDLFYERGHAPYVRHENGREPSVIFQTESVTLDHDAREYRCTVTTGQRIGDSFEIVYDRHRMYQPEGGIQAAVEGSLGAVELEDDGKGVLQVKTKAAGETLTIVIRPR